VYEEHGPQNAIEAQQQAQNGAGAALQGPRRADPNQVTQQAAQIEGTRVNQQPLEDVRPTSQVRTPHAACFVEVCEGALDSFATHAL
jgi:hypothetical protein